MPDLAKLKNAFPKESVARPISSPILGLVLSSSPSRCSVKFNLRMKGYYHRDKILSSACLAPLRLALANTIQTIRPLSPQTNKLKYWRKASILVYWLGD